jgi:altronate dehydratase
VHAIEPMGWRRRLGSIGIFLMITACAHGGASDAQSVDPASWAKTDLLVEVDGQHVYDHASECSTRDEAATSDERVLARTLATAPVDAMSRD